MEITPKTDIRVTDIFSGDSSISWLISRGQIENDKIVHDFISKTSFSR